MQGLLRAGARSAPVQICLLCVVGDNPACGAVDSDCAAVRDDPLRTRVTKRNAGAYYGFRVVPADKLDDDVPLLCAQPGTFCGRGTVGEAGHRRAGHKDCIDRRENAASSSEVSMMST